MSIRRPPHRGAAVESLRLCAFLCVSVSLWPVVAYFAEPNTNPNERSIGLKERP